MTRFLAYVVLTGAALFIATPHAANAGPADPTPYVVVQPDGSPIVVRTVGDEWASSIQTLDGFTIVRNNAGVWTYAIRVASGQVVATGLVAGRDQPPAAARRVLPNRPAGARDQGVASPLLAPQLGSRKTLVILVEFADKLAMTNPADWHTRVFASGQSSVREHYRVSSYNQLTLDAAAESHGAANDGVVGWLTLPSNHPNTGQNTGAANQQLTKDAILAADPFVDFAAFDTNGNGTLTSDELVLVVVAAGNETSFAGPVNSCSPGVWAHQWQILSVPPPTVDGKTVGTDGGYAQVGEMHCNNASAPGQIATIGLMTHEIGHILGLPDLYDLDGSSAGIGNWSLMANSWGRVVRPGDSPSLMDPWSKFFLGWITPTPVVGPMNQQNIPASVTSPTVFQFLNGSALSGTGEYFLVENRQQASFDGQLAGSGLLVWHIDEAIQTNEAECIPGGLPACSPSVHYKVALIQADHGFDLERATNQGDAGDPFPGASNNTTFTGLTSPNSRLWNGSASEISIWAISASGAVMTANFGFGALPGSFSKTSPANGASNLSTNATLNWGASAGATGYEYCVDTSNDNICSGGWVSAGTSQSANPAGLSAATRYYWQVRGTNGNGPIEANNAAWWTFTTVGFAGAVFNSTLQAPMCGDVSAECDTGADLIRGRGAMSGGVEPNQPNTINDSCSDGNLGLFQSDESINRIRIFTDDGQAFAPGKTVTVQVTAWIFDTGFDRLDLYYAANASAPAWTFIATVAPNATDEQTMTASYVLPAGGVQAIRARLRSGGSVATCTPVELNEYDDHDDLVFAVGPAAFTNFVQNGSFTSGAAGWSTFATPDSSYMVSSASGGVFQFYRVAPPAGTTNQAVVFQQTGTPLSGGAAMQASFKLANTDSVRKRISVLLHDADFSDLFVCTFWLPANQTPIDYHMRTHTTKPWANATISFYAASANTAGNTTGFYQLDDVSLHYAPGLPPNQTSCHDPTTPSPPGGADGPELIANGAFSNGLTSWALFGQINGAVNAGVFEFTRPPGDPAGVILQSIGSGLPIHQRLTATFQLGNSSAVRKRVTVILHDANFSDLSACTFWLEPGQALATYTYRTYATQAWANATFSVYGATAGPETYTRLDNVSLKQTPSAVTVGTVCGEP